MQAPLLRVLLPGFALLVLVGCRPFAAKGESCEKAPCAAGLVCIDAVCAEPPAPIPDPDACELDDDCALNGRTDGRACIEGRCAWLACNDDGDCGGRVCDRGTCAERDVCGDDADCDEGRVCEDGACRSACVSDGQCGGFSACDEGHCLSRCFFDLMCLGDLCEDGLCRPPECALDEDCPTDASYFCDGGRCVSFLPCGDDADCFDADYRCNELGRCEERPACRVDAECGADGLCLGGRCRPATTCSSDETCDLDEECLAGRCVERPACRSNADCGAEEACVDGACAEVNFEAASTIVVGTPLGDCEPGGEGACTLVLFEGETTRVQAAAFSDEGAPVPADTGAIATAAVVGVTDEGRGWLQLRALAAGSAALDVTDPSGARHDALQVVVLPAAAAGLQVLVVDEATGAPVSGASVEAGGETGTTDADGLARFAAFPSLPGELVVTARDATRGVALIGAPSSGALRIALPVAPAPSASAAGFTARVASSGDETGAVGLGLALPGLASLEEASLDALLGAPFIGALDLPILGQVPVELPAAATLEATLPVLGVQAVRERAFATTSAGRRAGLAYEGRFPEASLFELVGGAGATELALNLAAEAEGMDALAVHAGTLEALPLVVDGDPGDGVSDVDNDGDLDELVPDFAAMPELEITPSRLPRERVGLALAGLPEGAGARAFVAAGVELPGYGFAPLGIAAVTPPAEGEREAQVKIQPPADAALAAADRALVVEALFDEPAHGSRLVYRGSNFGAALALGSFLAPPTGAFVIDGLPAPGDRLLVLPEAPGGTTWRITFVDGPTRWSLVTHATTGGRSVVLPGSLASASIERVEVLRLAGPTAAEATAAPFVVGSGPTRLLQRAQAWATAPAR